MLALSSHGPEFGVERVGVTPSNGVSRAATLKPTIVTSFPEAVEHGGRAMHTRRDLLRQAQAALSRWDATRDPAELARLLPSLQTLAACLLAGSFS